MYKIYTENMLNLCNKYYVMLQLIHLMVNVLDYYFLTKYKNRTQIIDKLIHFDNGVKTLLLYQ